MKTKTLCILTALSMIFATIMPAVSQVPGSGYLVGTVVDVKDDNSMYVDFGASNIPGMQGVTLILLPNPVPFTEMLFLRGKQLTFALQGHDILGRPICSAYYNGISVNYLYYYPGRHYYYY